MVDGSAVLTTMMHGLMAQGRWRDEAGVNFADTGSPFYEVYECADGRYVGVGAIERPFYDELLGGLGLDGDELPDRRDEANWPDLKERFAAVFRTRTRDEWAERFAGTDACVAPCSRSPRRRSTRTTSPAATFVEHGGIVQPAPAPRFSRTPNTPRPHPAGTRRRHPRDPRRARLRTRRHRATPRRRRRDHLREADAMKVDATLPKEVERTKEAAADLEAAGYDGLWVGETKHDPFLQLLQAADATERVTIGTAIAIAFGRTPMTLANTAFDLARYSQGRFVLGLGSQVKPHIERRFSMPWSHPAPTHPRAGARHAGDLGTWQEGEPLDFRGDFYTHTLMTPFFSPAAPRVGSAAGVPGRRRVSG